MLRDLETPAQKALCQCWGREDEQDAALTRKGLALTEGDREANEKQQGNVTCDRKGSRV